MSPRSSAKLWFKKNRFSILASSLAFILSTAVNQSIDWYKDNKDQEATKSGLINETSKNIEALIRFNNKNPSFKNNCQNVEITPYTTQNLLFLPVMFSSEFYLSNSQKVSQLDKTLLLKVDEAYTSQQSVSKATAFLYSGGMNINKEAEKDLYSQYCDYQNKLKYLNESLKD